MKLSSVLAFACAGVRALSVEAGGAHPQAVAERAAREQAGTAVYNDAPTTPYAAEDAAVPAEEEQSKLLLVWMLALMIVVLEIGDKTFLIAALMAMRLLRLVVFSASFGALAVMTVLSGVVGHALPALIPATATKALALLLFVVFGIRLLQEGLAMSGELGVGEEMAEVEEEIAMAEINKRGDVEAGAAPAESIPWTEQVANLMAFVFLPTWVQVFVMTFLGEWGDRLQIATIAMAAGSDYWMVIVGAVAGHFVCTGGAVLGGKLLATRILMRTVTLSGACAFFVFAVLYAYEVYAGEE